jgi:ubiquinone/menaquinone biosynthesis C-methylase UbiE
MSLKNEGYLNKGASYFSNSRLDLINLLPQNPQQKVLEIGMGSGDTLLHIKENKLASEVVGIDLVELPGSNQHHPLIDKTYFLDLDTSDLPLPSSYFDVVIAGDVWEHLVDPWKALQKLSDVLKPGGYIITSIPNVRDYKALFSIIFKGRFRYTNEGIFDKTHLRFFCKKDMIQMIESVKQLKIERTMPIQVFGDKNPRRKILNKITFNIFEEFITSQYLFKIVKI